METIIFVILFAAFASFITYKVSVDPEQSAGTRKFQRVLFYLNAGLFVINVIRLAVMLSTGSPK